MDVDYPFKFSYLMISLLFCRNQCRLSNVTSRSPGRCITDLGYFVNVFVELLILVSYRLRNRPESIFPDNIHREASYKKDRDEKGCLRKKPEFFEDWNRRCKNGKLIFPA